jgi:alkyl hydroperoxide reductase subunit AhpC
MIELGELEQHHQDFAKRNTRVVVVSLESRGDAAKTQADFPHLVVVADESRGLTSVADAIHEHSSPDNGDTSAPANLVVDRHGVVRWQFRPARIFTRLSAEEVLAAIDAHLPAER